MNPPAHRPAAAVLFLLLVLPWVAPLSGGPSRNAWPYLVSLACMAGLLLLRRHWQPQAVACAWLAAALLSCAIAVVQYLGWAQYGTPWIAPIGPGEGSANLRQRNQFAAFTAVGLIALCYLASATAKRWSAAAWVGLAAALSLLAVGNAVTSSRTGALAWAAVLAAGLWIASRGGPRAMALLPALGLALYLCACALMPAALEWVQAQRGAVSPCAGGPCNAIERLADTGNDSRIALWRNVLELIALRPWTGWGWGELDYAHYVTLFGSPRFTEKLDNAHNLPLQLAVELGLPAAGLICVALSLLLWRARPWRESQPWRQAAWLVLAVIGLHSLLEYPLWYGPFQIAAVLCICGLCLHERSDQPPQPAHQQRAWAWDALAAAMLLTAAVVAFDYHRVSQIYLPIGQRHSAYRMQALEHAQASWFFQGHARFAQLALTPLSADNAAEQLRLAQWLLHHSPEPLVIERLLDAAALLGDAQTQAFHAARYQAAYPGDHARWLRRQQASRAADSS